MASEDFLYKDGRSGSFTAGEALVAGVVCISSTDKTLLQASSTTTIPFGVIGVSAASGATGVTVYNQGEYVYITAGGAISAGVQVYPAASGRIAATGASGAIAVGVSATGGAESASILVKLKL